MGGLIFGKVELSDMAGVHYQDWLSVIGVVQEAEEKLGFESCPDEQHRDRTAGLAHLSSLDEIVPPDVTANHVDDLLRQIQDYCWRRGENFDHV